MKKKPETQVDDPEEEIADLVRKLQETQERLCELAGGEVDAVVYPGGPSFLLHEAQEKLRRSEAALRHSEERLRVITNLIPHAIFVKDAAGRHIFANSALAEIAGFTVEEMIGKTDYDLVSDKAEAEAYRADDLAVIQSGRALIRTEEPRTDLSGRTRFLQTFKIPFAAPETGAPAVLGVFTDVTERKLAEDALVRQQAEMQILFDLIPAMLCFKNTENVFLRVNKRMAETAGKSIVEIEGKSASEIFPREAEQYYADDLEVIRTGRAKLGIIERLESVDGKRLWVQTDKVPVCDRLGKVTGIVVMVQDITERKRIEARFSRLVDSNAQGICFWNTNGRITHGNDAFLNLLRYARSDLQAGQINWATITPREYVELDARALEELAATGVCTPYEKECICKDGERVPILMGAAMFEDNPEEGVCFVLDLTERKKVERQFFRAQRMESLGTLAGGVAHDLNNSLTPIIMSLDLLATKLEGPENENLLDLIRTSAHRGAEMVKQVLCFARGVEGQRLEIRIGHIIRDIEKIVNDTFHKNIQIQAKVPHDLWTVLGDATQIHQVLLNLCLNARDAMPEGGKLTVTAENLNFDAHYAGLNHEAQPGPYVGICVEDTGTGMPAHVVDKIFDPFFTTKAIGQGTGLGLSTSLAIIKSHAGFIRVYSEPGKGTKLRVYLPAQIESARESPSVLKPELPRGQGQLILVVDDERAVREITRQTLLAFGYRVALAGDGAEGMAVYANLRREIAAVVTDMMMPGLDGLAAIQLLRRMHPTLPIIAASGLSTEAQIAGAASLGVKIFLAKPYTAETLLKSLEQALGEPPSGV